MKGAKKSIFWDYDISKIDLSDPKAKLWYLTRKLQFGDFSDITRKDLKQYLPKIKISQSLKNLLKNFLNSNV